VKTVLFTRSLATTPARPNSASGFGCVLTEEYQFAGDVEAHGVATP